MEKSKDIELDKRILQISKKLKKLRREKGYTSYETFAWDNDLPRVQYWRLEKGTYFNIKSLFKVLDVHQMTLEEFFKGIK